MNISVEPTSYGTSTVLFLFSVWIIVMYLIYFGSRPRARGARPSVPDSPLVPPSLHGESEKKRDVPLYRNEYGVLEFDASEDD
jgi:hypothetical protein